MAELRLSSRRLFLATRAVQLRSLHVIDRRTARRIPSLFSGARRSCVATSLFSPLTRSRLRWQPSLPEHKSTLKLVTQVRPERRRIVSPPDVLLQPSGDASPRTRLTGQRNLVDHRERTATDGDARRRNHARPADRYLGKIHRDIFTKRNRSRPRAISTDASLQFSSSQHRSSVLHPRARRAGGVPHR